MSEAFPPPTFDDRPLEVVRVVRMRVTAYSPDDASCAPYADGWTASGFSVWTNGMRLVAADPSVLPLGSVVGVPGYNHGLPVPVLDVGGAITGLRLDVLFPTHEAALRWGVRHLPVTIYRFADEPSPGRRPR
jgi:3D (Asp-Asp-Asp) domain-containing protein